MAGAPMRRRQSASSRRRQALLPPRSELHGGLCPQDFSIVASRNALDQRLCRDLVLGNWGWAQDSLIDKTFGMASDSTRATSALTNQSQGEADMTEGTFARRD